MVVPRAGGGVVVCRDGDGCGGRVGRSSVCVRSKRMNDYDVGLQLMSG